MAGGVHPAEWIIPVVGASHLAYNAVAQQFAPRMKLNTPGSKNAKQQTLADNQLRQRELQAQKAAADAEARERARMARLPSAVRQRALLAESQLPERGSRQSASAYLGAP